MATSIIPGQTPFQERQHLGIETEPGTSVAWSSIMEWSGMITSDSKIVNFTMYTKGAWLNAISTITVTSCSVVMRGINGYIDGFTSYTELVGKSGYTVTATKTGMNCWRMAITKSSAMSNATNNTPVTVSGRITCTFNA